jgi:chaperonin GroEL
MNNKKIYFGNEAREFLKNGLDIVANAVKVTLGYGGRTVVISETGMPSRTTKDGVTVAKSIKLKDERLDAGAKFIKDISAKTADGVGDGTTTVTVLMQRIVTLGISKINRSANPVYLKKGLDMAAEVVVEKLKKMAIPITDELLLGVATVSANNDPVIGELISDAYKKLGKHAIITVDESKDEKTYIELVNGFHFISGFTTHHFINNFAKNTCELENPYVLMAHGRINDPKEIWDLLNRVAAEKRSLLIIAEDFDISVTQNLLNNAGVMKSCLVKYNFLGDTKEELIHDLCAVTGSTLMEKRGDAVKNIGIHWSGRNIINKREFSRRSVKCQN